MPLCIKMISPAVAVKLFSSKVTEREPFRMRMNKGNLTIQKVIFQKESGRTHMETIVKGGGLCIVLGY